jgi:hypothetical protein
VKLLCTQENTRLTLGEKQHSNDRRLHSASSVDFGMEKRREQEVSPTNTTCLSRN